MDVTSLNKLLGNIDLHLLDQILKGQFSDGTVLDVGCGEGRNLTWFLHQHADVTAVDVDEVALKMVRMMARSMNCPVETIHGDFMDLKDQSFDRILFINVWQHVTSSAIEVEKKLRTLLNPSGLLFVKYELEVREPLDLVSFDRLGTPRVEQIGERRWQTMLLQG